jgi:phage-Barnase-EndoU-ColicinE5/D-RelE like nuclease3
MIEILDFDRIKADISALYDECLATNTPFHRKLDLFIVPESLAIKVQEATGIDINGHWVCMDNFGIIHTLEQHGNPISESRRGQIAVEKEDFERFLEVFLYPDDIQLAGVTKRTNLPLIQFIKKMGHKTFVIKEVRTISSLKKKKVSRLVFHTMYKIKSAK